MAHEEQDRYALAARVFDLLAPELAAESYELVDVRIFRGGGRLQVRLYVDRPGNEKIDLDDCARASRTAGMFLEEADPFAGPWVLEVSSPGVRRPLRSLAHFAAAEGQDVELKLRRPDGRPRRLRGRLLAAGSDGLAVLPAGAGRDRRQGDDADKADEADQTDEAGETGETGEAADDEPTAGAETLRIPLADVLEANLDRDFDVRSVINADRRRRKEERRRERQERRKGSRGRPKKTDDDAADQE